MSQSKEQLQSKEGIKISNLIVVFNKFSDKYTGKFIGSIPHALEKEAETLVDNGYPVTRQFINKTAIKSEALSSSK